MVSKKKCINVSQTSKYAKYSHTKCYQQNLISLSLQQKKKNISKILDLEFLTTHKTS